MKKLSVALVLLVMAVSCTSAPINEELEGIDEHEIQLIRKGDIETPTDRDEKN